MPVVWPWPAILAGRCSVCGSPRDHIGSGLVNEPGTFCWNELTTRAVDESVAFYQAVFGWKVDRKPGYIEFQTVEPEHTVAGLMAMDGDEWPADLPNHWMVYFTVADTDATAATAVELGGEVPVPPFDIPNVGRAAVLNDPSGAVFSIISMVVHDE